MGGHRLNVSEDRWVEVDRVADAEATSPGLDEFLEELEGLDRDSLDFREAVRRYLADNDVGDGTKRILLEELEV